VRHHSPAGTFSRVPGRCLHWSPTPPGPRWPPALRYNTIYYIFIIRWIADEVLRLFRRYTHTPCLRQGGVLANEVKMRMKRGMKMRWEWKWDEGLLNRDPRRGTQKKRERANTNTNTPGPRSGQTLKGQEKRKAEADGHGTRPAEGGRRKRLNQPNTAKTYAYLGTHRTRPTMGREKNAWNRGANRELKLVNRKKQRLNGIQFFPKESCVTPSRERCQVKPCGHKQLFKFQRIGCTTCSTSPDTKETIPAGKGHAWCLQSHMCSVHVPLQKLRW